MIRKTMTITFIAILIAAVSVATTITMVEADPESASLTATFGYNPGNLCLSFPAGGVIGATPNPILGTIMTHHYSDLVFTKPLTVVNTNPASLPCGYFDAVEPSLQSGMPAANVPIPPPLTLWASIPGPACIPATPALDVYLGFEEGDFTFDTLNAGQNYWVKVTQSEMDDFEAPGPFPLFTEGTCTTAALETTFVSANTVSLGTVVAVDGNGQNQLITTTVGVGKADPLGDMTIGFIELFSFDPIGGSGFCDTTTAPCLGFQPGIRVEQIELILASQSTGFWKNHESVVDTLTDGMEIDLLGNTDILINDGMGIESDDIFQETKKTKGDARPQLAAQLLAAQLNIKNGAVSCIDATEAIADAQAALIALGYTGDLDDGVKPKKNSVVTKSEVNAIKDILDDYNNNLLCPSSGDTDGDGLTDDLEAKIGSDPRVADIIILQATMNPSTGNSVPVRNHVSTGNAFFGSGNVLVLENGIIHVEVAGLVRQSDGIVPTPTHDTGHAALTCFNGDADKTTSSESLSDPLIPTSHTPAALDGTAEIIDDLIPVGTFACATPIVQWVSDGNGRWLASSTP